jgi:hypothetical protein
MAEWSQPGAPHPWTGCGPGLSIPCPLCALDDGDWGTGMSLSSSRSWNLLVLLSLEQPKMSSKVSVLSSWGSASICKWKENWYKDYHKTYHEDWKAYHHVQQVPSMSPQAKHCGNCWGMFLLQRVTECHHFYGMVVLVGQWAIIQHDLSKSQMVWGRIHQNLRTTHHCILQLTLS